MKKIIYISILLTLANAINSMSLPYEHSRISWAISNNNLEQIQQVPLDGVDLNRQLFYPTSNYDTHLHHAVARGNASIVKYLIEKGAQVDNDPFESGSALSDAAQQGKSDIVKILLEAGANINKLNRYESTPIGEAIRNYDAAMTRLLIDNKAQLDIAGTYILGEKATVLDIILEHLNNNLENMVRHFNVGGGGSWIPLCAENKELLPKQKKQQVAIIKLLVSNEAPCFNKKHGHLLHEFLEPQITGITSNTNLTSDVAKLILSYIYNQLK